jgi:hypothetical protein
MAASTSLGPTERKLRASLAAHESWVNTEDRTARSQHGRDAFRQSFEDKVDPDHRLDPTERAKRAENAFKAHMSRLALASAKARRKKDENKKTVNATNAGDDTRRSPKTGDVTADVSAG